MSEPVMQRLKISREGVILIKSFEGFRPHAVRREDGRWVIGYGHTLSAREGGVVSEPDAELLLQYDLLPVAAALNDIPHALNQHQFDALASFAFSVGLDRFQSSNVLDRLTSGASGEAADAIVGWSEPAVRDTPLRRRAAERALFVADPDRPVALADLLAAPLPPPSVVMPVFAAHEPVQVETADEALDDDSGIAPFPVPVATPSIEPTVENSLEPTREAAPADTGPVAGPKAEALADEGVSSDERPQLDILPALEVSPESEAEVAAVPQGEIFRIEHAVETAETVSLGGPHDPTDDASFLEKDEASKPAELAEEPWAQVPGSTVDFSSQASDDFLAGTDDAVASMVVPSLQHDAAYASTVIGPLRGAIDAETNVPQTSSPLTDPTSLVLDDAPISDFPSQGIPAGDAPIETAAPVPFDATISAQSPAIDGGERLVLTPSDDTSPFVTQRLVWPHAEATELQSPLFEDDGALRLGAHQMIRHEIATEEPRRLDWREIGLYGVMSGFGLLTFGMSVAAFRRASLPSGGSEFTTIAWVLAVFGFACIAVSAWNLYRKLGRPED